MADKPLVFISCGQFNPHERQLGSQVAKLVEETLGFEGYFAQNQTSLAALAANVFAKLDRAVALIAIMHPRGTVTGGDTPHVRGSLWIEQEIAIAAFLRSLYQRPIEVAAYVHKEITTREGVREQLQWNPVVFENDEEVLAYLAIVLPKWSGLQYRSKAPELTPHILMETVNQYGNQRTVQVRVELENTGSEDIERFCLDVMVPRGCIQPALSYANMERDKGTPTHALLRVTEETHKIKTFWRGDKSVIMSFPIDIDETSLIVHPENFERAHIIATVKTPGAEPKTVSRPLSEIKTI